MSNVTQYPSITVSRSDLMNSQHALNAISGIKIAAEKDNYWLVTTMDRVQKQVKKELQMAQDESNQFINEHGEMQKDKDGNDTGQKGISPENVELMKKYVAHMEAYTAKPVEIKGVKIKLSSLKSIGVALPVSDFVALQWLIDEEA